MRRRATIQGHRIQPFHGFTLLELLAVIAIIGLLAAVALPAIGRIRERARIGAVKGQLAQIETAIEQYYAEWDTYPPMGNDWLGEGFFPSEDVGTDKRGPFALIAGVWQVNPLYTGPDPNGTEGNYRLDPGEDLGLDLTSGTGDTGEDNGRLDGTYYDRLGMFESADLTTLKDLFDEDTLYHYYAGHVTGMTDYGMPEYRSYANLANYRNDSPAYYNRWVIYSIGPDETDHGLHNYYLTMQSGEDVGADAYASDPADEDSDFILFEPSGGENNGVNTAIAARTIVETQWTTPGGGGEANLPGGSGQLDVADGKPVFSFDVRKERQREEAVFATPDGDAVAFGVIMRYGP